MYYPPHQIKTNLNTIGGEFITFFDQIEYKGDYYQTSTGEYYTGKTPTDGDNYLLVPTLNNNTSKVESGNEDTTQNSIWVVDDSFYVDKKSINNGVSQIQNPLQIYPSPTPSDYEFGEMVRYFVKKTNEIKFIEISKFEYNKYIQKSENVPYQIYTPFTIIWELTGDLQTVYDSNYKTVKRTEESQKLYGLEQYFKGNFTQLYKP